MTGQLNLLIGVGGILVVLAAYLASFRHVRAITSEVLQRLDLDPRAWWRVELRTVAGFDESIRKLQAKALKKDRQQAAPSWWDDTGDDTGHDSGQT